MEDFILNPDPARVMEGLRDTGYNFNTAIADLVDNCIAADATTVKITLTTDLSGMNPLLFIADNGCGMTLEGLKNAMRYGSNRRENAASLGKFGLGLKTASTAFCRCLSLVSRGEDGAVNKVTWDLDHICKVNKWSLLHTEPIDDDVEMLDSVANQATGTLVIWDNVDRLVKQYKNPGALNNALIKHITELKFHLSMVFQRYLDPTFGKCSTIELYVNDERIEPWDPFLTKHQATKCLQHKIVPVTIETSALTEPIKTSFELDAYLLPRKEEFSTSQEKSDARIRNEMQGFYVYRENRLIYWGNWLNLCIRDPHISLLRINFSFDHTLDDWFDVDIKKSRIQLTEEIFAYLSQFIAAPKREAENLYRNTRTKDNGTATAGAHSSSNNVINTAKVPVQSTVTVVDSAKNQVKIKSLHNSGNEVGTLTIMTAPTEGQNRVVAVDDVRNGCLWEPALIDQQHAVRINKSHDFYTKVYAANKDNEPVIIALDSLLWALAEAEISTINEEVQEQYEDMRVQVSRSLRKLVKDLPEPIDEEENE